MRLLSLASEPRHDVIARRVVGDRPEVVLGGGVGEDRVGAAAVALMHLGEVQEMAGEIACQLEQVVEVLTSSRIQATDNGLKLIEQFRDEAQCAA
jgi:hypothetical protein